MKKIILLFVTLCISLTACSNGTISKYTDAEIKAIIEETFYGWMEQEIEYEDAKKKIGQFQYTSNEEIKTTIDEYLAFMEIEEIGFQLFKEAEENFGNDLFSKAMATVLKIDDSYTQKELAINLYDKCKEIILLTVSEPINEDDYNQAIEYLSKCLKDVDDADLQNRLTELEDELVILKKVLSIIYHAQYNYSDKKYLESFNILEEAIIKYPDSKMLRICLDNFHNLYILEIHNKVKELCEEKEYKEAKEIVNKATKNYDCEEFDLLLETIKEKQIPIYKWGKDFVRYFTTLFSSWQTEELTVQKAAENAGNYIVKSGKKLFLGDYSEDEVTVLSFGANIVAALANLDVMFDIRDLTYDLTHWGEEEYFVLYIAADVIALVPVLGMLKYLKNFDKSLDGLKDISKIVENVSDISKQTDNIADAIDNISDGSKTIANLAEAVDQVTDTTKNADEVAEIIKNAKTGYTRYFQTINSSLKGGVHPKTGVEFIEKTVKYTYVDDVVAVFAKFDSKFNCILPKEFWMASDDVQFRECSKMLYNSLENNKSLKALFDEEQIKQLSKGEVPTGWTWHHNEEEGLMQLVDAKTHKETNHHGGRFFWGGGETCRKSSCELPN